MNKEEQQIAILTVLGFNKVDPPMDYLYKGTAILTEHWFEKDGSFIPMSYLPDYLNDLNAMHEAEKKLIPEGQGKSRYETTLLRITQTNADYVINEHPNFFLAHATAAQRAEAFLRTLNLWKD